MKFSILGFNQAKVIETSLDLTDLVLLQYIQQACGSSGMKHMITEDGQTLVWIYHEKISEDLPILGLAEGSLRNRLAKLKKDGYLVSEQTSNEAGRGKRTYYGITEATMSLIYDMVSMSFKNDMKDTTTSFENDMKDTTMSLKNDMKDVRPCHLKMTSDNILNNKDNILNKDSLLNTDISLRMKPTPEEIFEQVWNLYPKKVGKSAISKSQKIKLAKIGIDELTRCVERYIDVIKKENREPKYILNGDTFFRTKYTDYLDENYQDAVSCPNYSKNGFDANDYILSKIRGDIR